MVKNKVRKIGRWIKSYLEMENINHIDLSNVDMKDRVNYVIQNITK